MRAVSSAAMADLPRRSAPPADGASGDLRRRCVLVVDDYAANRQVVRAMLTHSGYAVREARDGEEALAAMAQARFDAVLLDCEMPGLDGYGAAAEIRRREGDGPRTPIIALTASARRQDAERARAAGMDLHLPKPVTLQRLRYALDAVLGATCAGERSLQTPAVAHTGRELDPAGLAQLRRVYPDERDLHEFVTLVVDDTRARVELLAASAGARDPGAVRAAAHVLQGSCALIGAQRVVALLRDIERRARAGAAPGDTLIAELENALRAALDELAETLR